MDPLAFVNEEVPHLQSSLMNPDWVINDGGTVGLTQYVLWMIIVFALVCLVVLTAGKRLTLADVTNGTEAEIKERIVNALLAQYPGVEEAGVMETPMDAIRGMKMEDFSFYVKDGAVHVFFSKYEITYGAAGAFDVVLVDPAG